MEMPLPALALILTDSGTVSVTAQVGPSIQNSGGGGNAIPATVTFSGRAYPLSHVTVLKDGVVATTGISESDGLFSLTLTLPDIYISAYDFSVFDEDLSGQRSSLESFPLSVNPNVTITVSGIFFSPTINIDKTEIRKGDTLLISGYAEPFADIAIAIDGNEQQLLHTLSNKDGLYSYSYDTASLGVGAHEVKSKALFSGTGSESSYGNTLVFAIGESVIKKQACIVTGDFNGDCKVNIVDFSMLAYWYKKPSPPARFDLNADKKIDMADFSILAYFWTG